MVQEGVFKDDLTTEHIEFEYREFLDGYGTQGDGFQEGDDAAPDFLLRVENPLIYGNGPIEASTCTVLVPVYPPVYVWDVEGYYRSLGVSHHANRLDLRRAYQARAGQGDVRLTFAVKTLLNPQTRYEYDTVPLGGRYVDDPVVQDEVKAAAARLAMQLRAQGHYTTAEAILSQWGFRYVDDTSQEVVNDESHNGPLQDEDLAYQHEASNTWCYAYYLWRTTNVEGPVQQWQEALVRAANEQGLDPFKVTVGLVGNGENPYQIENIQGRWVVLLRDGEMPSNSLAHNAITHLTQLS